MSTIKISKHSDVPAALDIVKEEVEKEARRIFHVGGDALKEGKIKPAKEAIAYAEGLQEFVAKIQKLGDEWKQLEAKIDAAAPEVKEIVQRGPDPIYKPHKTGFTKKVEHVAPKTNFTVTFPDGRVISDKKALNVLAKTIEKIGAQRVADVGIMLGGEPLVTKNKALYVKYPSAVVGISGGWFVNTHSSTKDKMEYIKKIAKAIGIKLFVKYASSGSSRID